MQYVSTRGRCPSVAFEQAVLQGLAPDGGLYVPEQLPHYSTEQLQQMRGLSYNELAQQLLLPLMQPCIMPESLQSLIQQAYAPFASADAVSLKPLGERLHLLELFHGPTLAFKDVAMQLLGRLLNLFGERNGRRSVALVATSGDTGSAALEACRHCDNLDAFVLFPEGRVSDFQRRQMTTLRQPGVHCVAIKGDFDDCQQLVKIAFLQEGFLPTGYELTAMNSINWARVAAQLVYYFYAALRLGAPEQKVTFVVPTGNFGNVYAGYTAARMGLPISKLLLATNRNDILHRLVQSNDYRRLAVEPSHAPSMDISVASNFERLVYDLVDGDGARVDALFQGFAERGALSLSDAEIERVRSHFFSVSCSDEQILQEIRRVYEQYAEVIDPHTATATAAAQGLLESADDDSPVVVLATAHPVKFADAIRAARVPQPQPPQHYADLGALKERYDTLDACPDALQGFIQSRLG